MRHLCHPGANARPNIKSAHRQLTASQVAASMATMKLQPQGGHRLLLVLSTIIALLLLLVLAAQRTSNSLLEELVARGAAGTTAPPRSSSSSSSSVVEVAARKTTQTLLPTLASRVELGDLLQVRGAAGRRGSAWRWSYPTRTSMLLRAYNGAPLRTPPPINPSGTCVFTFAERGPDGRRRAWSACGRLCSRHSAEMDQLHQILSCRSLGRTGTLYGWGRHSSLEGARRCRHRR